MKYSIIIPAYNEEKNVAPLHAEILATMQTLGEPFEILFVNDGSTDGTAAALDALSPITVIHLRKNFGQTAALDAGIKHATGEIIITLDGDGQNPPSEIPKLLAEMERGGYDVVSGWRRNRQDSFMKRLVSRGAKELRGVFVKDRVHDSGCSLKAYKRICFQDVDLHGEMHRFIPAILSWSGFSVGEVEVAHRARMHGHSKYSWKRIVKGLIDMLSIWFWRKYANRPLHLFGTLGIALGLIGMSLIAYLFVKRVIWEQSIADSNLPLLAVFLFILGIQFFISGISIDINIRQLYSGHKKIYSIRDITKK
jgi:glycosyltransferase involved in cell wall biosynthesis